MLGLCLAPQTTQESPSTNPVLYQRRHFPAAPLLQIMPQPPYASSAPPLFGVSLDEDGFLKAEFSGADITHANQAYGRILLDRLSEALLRY